MAETCQTPSGINVGSVLGRLLLRPNRTLPVATRAAARGQQPLFLAEQQRVRGVWLRQSAQDKPATFWHRQTPPGAVRFRIERYVALIQCLSKIRRRKSLRYFVGAQLVHVAPDQPYNPVVLTDAELFGTRQGIRPSQFSPVFDCPRWRFTRLNKCIQPSPWLRFRPGLSVALSLFFLQGQEESSPLPPVLLTPAHAPPDATPWNVRMLDPQR